MTDEIRTAAAPIDLPPAQRGTVAARRVTVRQFVCQECFKVGAVLYGRGIICSCGAKSSAEIIDD